MVVDRARLEAKIADLQQRRREFWQQKTQAEANMHACDGAIEVCQQWLDEREPPPMTPEGG